MQGSIPDWTTNAYSRNTRNTYGASYLPDLNHGHLGGQIIHVINMIVANTV